MKKRVISLMLTAAMTLSMVLTGCGSKETNAGADAGELNLFIWTEYVPTTRKLEFQVFPRLAAMAEKAGMDIAGP